MLKFVFFASSRLLAYLSNRICENRELTLTLPPPSSASNTPSEGQNGPTVMTVRAYLLEHIIGGTHLRDRLGMQRFIGSLLLAAWPSPSKLDLNGMQLPEKMNHCLTNVVYFEEILGKNYSVHCFIPFD